MFKKKKPYNSIGQEFIYHFSGFHGFPSRCHIRVLDESDKPLVILCTQVINNPGTSITNCIEEIAFGVITHLSKECYSLEKRKIILVEHYGRGNSITGDKTYAIVNFNKPFIEPRWEYVSVNYLMKKTGYRSALFDTPQPGRRSALKLLY